MIPNGEGWPYFVVKKLFKFFSTKNKQECYRKLCENKDFCNVVMTSEDTKILEFNHEHVLLGFSMSAISTFKSIENKHDVYRSKYCMKKFCKYLKEQVMKIIILKRKKRGC